MMLDAALLLLVRKQSTEMTWELASETGAVCLKKVSNYSGHLKLKEETRRMSWKWFIKIFM